jgi:signal peptidase I
MSLENNEEVTEETKSAESTEVSNEASNESSKEDLKEDSNATSSEEKINLKKELISWVQTIVFAFVCAFIITHVFIVNARVPSASMETTIMTGDRLIANRLAYKFSDPERFDIVVFKYPDDPEQKTLYIKRIIGLPGDKIEIKDNEIYINDNPTPIDSSFIREPMLTADAVYNVPEDSYFMMGDNRNNSADSRFWQDKFVKKDKILGKAVFRYYPLGEMGAIKKDGIDEKQGIVITNSTD